MESKFFNLLNVCEEQALKVAQKIIKLKYWAKSEDYSITESEYSKLFGETQELISICSDIERSLNWIDLKGKNNE